MSDRDEFEAWRETCGYNTDIYQGVLWLCWQAARASPPQEVLALTEPVAWHIGNADGSINKIGAVYIRRSLAEKHIASYEGELDAKIVPLYATAQPVAVPALTWAGLTDKERDGFVDEIVMHGTGFVTPLYAIIEEIEGLLRAKNAAAPQPSQEPEKAPQRYQD